MRLMLLDFLSVPLIYMNRSVEGSPFRTVSYLEDRLIPRGSEKPSKNRFRKVPERCPKYLPKRGADPAGRGAIVAVWISI